MIPLSDGVRARHFPFVNVALIVANFAFGLASASANGGGVAFFAHVGGFAFGFIVARLLLKAGRVTPQESPTAVSGFAPRPIWP